LDLMILTVFSNLSDSTTNPSSSEAQTYIPPSSPPGLALRAEPFPQPGPSLSPAPLRRGHGGAAPLSAEPMAVPGAAPSRLALALAALAALAAVKYYRDAEAARQQVAGRRGGPSGNGGRSVSAVGLRGRRAWRGCGAVRLRLLPCSCGGR